MKKLRRADRAVSRDESEDILTRGEYGVLATIDSSGNPVGIPLNYVWFNGAVYFHSATEGEKLDNIGKNSAVSFTVVAKTEVLPAAFSTVYESVVIAGQAVPVEGEEKSAALNGLIEKYSPDYIEEGKKYIDSAGAKTAVVKINVSEMTGKARKK